MHVKISLYIREKCIVVSCVGDQRIRKQTESSVPYCCVLLYFNHSIIVSVA